MVKKVDKCIFLVNIRTLFRGLSDLSGSSAANIADEIMIQTRTMLPKYE